MTVAVVLALVSAVGWGVSDFLGGVRSRISGLLPVLLTSQVAALVLVGGFAAASGAAVPDRSHLLLAAAAGVSEAIGVGALYRGLAVGRASVVAPVAAAAPVVPFAVGVVLGQIPGPVQLAGLAMVVVGIVLAAHQRRTSGHSAASAVAHGTLSALGFGAFFVFMDAAGDGSVSWALLVARAAAVTVIISVVLATRTRIRIERTEIAVPALIGALIVMADAAYTAASTTGQLGVVAVLGAFHPVVTIGLAAAVLRERIDVAQRVGIAAAALGVVAVAAL